MVAARSNHAIRLLAAALTRRRALKGAAGAAALVLGGYGGHRVRATTVPPALDLYLGLPRAVLVPADLPDGDRLGVAAGTTFLGAGGAAGLGALNEQLLGALKDTSAALVGGHVAILAPLDGSRDRTAFTLLLQFRTPEDASGALGDLAADYYAGVREVTPDEARGRFFEGTTEQNGTFTHQEVVLFRSGAVVTIITVAEQTNAAPPEPNGGEVAERMEALRRTIALRLRDVNDPEMAGIRRPIPGVAQFGAASAGQVQFGIDSWLETYLQVDGRPVRQLFQSDDDARRFREDHSGLSEFVRLTQYVRTTGGSTILVRSDGFRFDDSGAAKAFFDTIEARAEAATTRNPAFAALPLGAASGVSPNLPAKALLNRFTSSSEQTIEAQIWVLLGADVCNVSVGGPPRSPDDNADEAYVTALFNLAIAGVLGFQLWNDVDGLTSEQSQQGFTQVYGLFAAPCGAYDAALA